MARITWQNVTAPNFSGAAESRRLGADLLGSGMENIGGAISALDSGLREKQNAAAMQQALQIQDTAGWDKMMAEGGIQALGISPDRASSDLMQFVTGRRDKLLSDEKAAYTDVRAREEDGRTNAARILGENANVLADKIAFEQLSAEDAQQAIIKATEGDVKLREAALAELAKQDPSTWAVLPGTAVPAEVGQITTGIAQTVAERNSELDFSLGGNDALRLMTEGAALSSAGGSAVEGLASKMTSAMQLEDGEEKTKTYAENMGSLVDGLNSLRAKFPHLSAEIVAAAMDRSLQSNGWIFTGDKAEVAYTDAEALLTSIDTPENRQGLRNESNQITQEKAQLAGIAQRVDYLSNRLAMATSRGTPASLAEAEEIKLELAAIFDGLAPMNPASQPAIEGLTIGQEVPGPATGSSDPAVAAIASAAGGVNTAGAMDPRVALSREIGGSLVDGFGRGVQNIGESIDTAAGSVAALGGLAAGGATSLAGGLASLVSPSAGEAVFNAADGMYAQAGRFADQGLLTQGRTSFDPRNANDPAPVPAQPAIQVDPQLLTSVSKDPVGSLRAVLAETSLSAQGMSQVESILTALETGTSLNGQDPLSRKDRERLEGRLNNVLDQLQADGEGGSTVQQLLGSRDKWLKFGN